MPERSVDQSSPRADDARARRLVDVVREVLRARHYGYRTEQAYLFCTHVLNRAGGRGIVSPADDL